MLTRQELAQEARVAGWLAERDFDPTRGVPLPQYRAMRIRWATQEAWRQEQRGRHAPLDSSLRFSHRDRYPFEDDDVARAITATAERLPPRLRLVLTLVAFYGWTYPQVGDLLGVSDARILQLHHHARDVMRYAWPR